MSRSTSLRVDPNVFGDEHAIDGSPDVSPVDSIQNSSENLTVPNSQPRTSLASPPTAHLYSSRPNSTAKRTFQDASNITASRAISMASRSGSSAQRTSSTSSRFSMPRAQSPYIGTTGPSHPYGMYPQVTRTSSIASESTIRPLDTAFVGGGGPEHPYSLYPQNVLSEDDGSIPLGFPGMGRNYQTRTAGHDVADIVGVDGHVEELPPYTRYAEDVPPKPTSESVAVTTIPAPPLSPISQHSDAAVELNLGAARDAGNSDEKRGWKRKARRRVCAGLPLWTVIVTLVIIVFAAALGGIIGGVVGVHKGANAATSALATSAAAASTGPASTTTVYLDATPIPSSSPAPDSDSCATGNFSIDLGSESQASSCDCVKSPAYAAAWSCFPPQGIDIQVTPIAATLDGHQMLNVSFLDSADLGPNFPFGAQSPILPGSFTLRPFGDKNNGDPSLFFWTYYEKVSIWPLSTFPLPPSTQSTKQRRSSYSRRQEQNQNQTNAELGAHVWVCSWPETVLEFFMYPTQQTTSPIPSSQSPTSSCTTSWDPTPTSTGYATMSNPEAYTASHTWTGGNTQWSPPAMMSRRQSEPSQEDYPPYPLNIKILEKRKQAPNPPVTCELNIVQENWSLTPAPNVGTIVVEENDYQAGSSSSQDDGITQRSDSLSYLRSLCACEYMTSN